MFGVSRTDVREITSAHVNQEGVLNLRSANRSKATMYPEDVDPQSGCGLPLPRREEQDEAGQRTYDSLADPKGGTIRGLRGPGGIMLHSPELSRHARPLNRYLRHEAGLGGRVRELAILTTARELPAKAA